MTGQQEMFPRHVGYSGKKAAEIVGITYRQLDYWARTDLVRPSLADADGSGSRRRYSYRDLLELKVIKSLLDAGIRLEPVREVFDYLRDNLGEDAASANLVIGGEHTRCSSGTARRSSTWCAGARACSTSCRSRRGRGGRRRHRPAVPRGRRRRRAGSSVEVAAEQSSVGGAPRAVRLRPQLRAAVRRLLDFYGIEWRVRAPHVRARPRTPTGNPTQAFTPDFYLPDFDLYIEITTLNQRLVTKKNRKVRRCASATRGST